MDKKRFDHIEQDMRAAAEGWEPPFDEGAWEQMEKMLEGENDRKRPVAWWMWLLPLLLVTGTTLYFVFNNDNNSSEKTPAITVQNIPAGNQIAGKPTNENLTNPVDNNATNNTNVAVTDDVFSKQQLAANGRARINVWPAAASTTGNSSDDIKDTRRISDQQNGRMKMSVNGGVVSGDEEKTNRDEPVEEATKENKQPVGSLQKDVAKTPAPVTTKTTETKQQEPVTQKQKDKKEKQQQPSKFYFSLFAGMEGNAVDFPGLNKISPRAGFTVGYQLTKNLSVQTGFFAGSKKYVAGRYDYKAKPGSYWSTVDITKVDADCRVFEIPVALRWDFNPSAKWNAFAGTGLSSYIMDKEDYAYDYIRYNNPYHAKASYTGNQHLFSVLRITGGVERKLSKQFSVGINPGLAIPLAGVGEGQIKLFSTELLLSLKYRPFKK